MLDAMIPYVTAPELMLGSFKLEAFGLLVAAGLFIGRWRCMAYARRKDLDQELFGHYLLVMLISAFCISHWICVFFYFPEKVAREPIVILQIWNGLSSVGGFFGAFVGGVVYLRWYCARQAVGRQPVLIFSDTSVFGLLIGWCFGRAGCSIVHDHPGQMVPEGTFLAVGPWPDGSWRYDLGLVEMLFAITLMAIVYFGLRWYRWAPGRLTGLVLTVYAPFRFFLDSLRADEAARGVIAIPDERYLGLTPAQWFTMVFLVGGLWLLLRKSTPADLAYAKESDRLEREAAKTKTSDSDSADKSATE